MNFMIHFVEMDYWTVTKILNIKPKNTDIGVTCEVCEFLLKEAHQTQCGCRICKACIIETENECQICKEPWSTEANKVFTDKATDKVISMRVRYCPFKECMKRCRLKNMQQHMDQCEWRKEVCQKCGVIIRSAEMREHIEQKCLEQEQDCEYCGESMTKQKLLDEHWKIAEKPDQELTTCKFYQQVATEEKRGASKENIMNILNFIKRKQYEDTRQEKEQQLRKIEKFIQKEKRNVQAWEKQREKSNRNLGGIGNIENNFTWKTDFPELQITLHEFIIRGWLGIVRRTKRSNGYIITRAFGLPTSYHTAYLKIYPNGSGWKTRQHVTATLVIGDDERKNTQKRSIEDKINIAIEYAPEAGKSGSNVMTLKRKKTNQCIPRKGRKEMWDKVQLVPTSETMAGGKYMIEDTIKIKLLMSREIPATKNMVEQWLREIKPPESTHVNIMCQKAWKLGNMTPRTRDGLRGLEWKFDSLAFDAGQGGEYKIRIAPYGCGEGKDTHLSIALIITKRGRKDNLEWLIKTNSIEEAIQKTVQFKLTIHHGDRSIWSTIQPIKRYKESEKSQMQGKGGKGAVCEKLVPLDEIFRRWKQANFEQIIVECIVWKDDPGEALRY